jgi:hypothetical protein
VRNKYYVPAPRHLDDRLTNQRADIVAARSSPNSNRKRRRPGPRRPCAIASSIGAGSDLRRSRRRLRRDRRLPSPPSGPRFLHDVQEPEGLGNEMAELFAARAVACEMHTALHVIELELKA